PPTIHIRTPQKTAWAVPTLPSLNQDYCAMCFI
ncbi:MAG: hypothetical protein ACI9Y1_003533, partial [Lentisphaeria bacterium]